MKTIPHLRKFLLVFVLSLFVFACSNNDDDANPGTDDAIGNTDDDVTPSLPNIVELAESVDVLSTLLDAIEAADPTIADALAGDGPFTVFAPTNDAFNDLLNQLDDFDGFDDFDEDAEQQLLASILQYHVISGTEAFSNNLSDGTVLTTLQTEEITVNVDGGVFIEDKTEELAEVVSADNDASNGVVHIINKVLLPQEVLDALFPKPSIVELVVETEELSLLEEAVIKANLVDALNAEGPFTVFAPTNAAIEELFELLGDSFTSFDDFDNFLELQILEQILLYHAVPGNVTSSDLAPGMINTLLQDETLEIISDGNTFVISDASDIDANILSPDQEASNGVVHVIDKILIPQEIQDFLDMLNPDDPDSGLPTIREIVESTDELDFLREALEITGLLETLGEDGPFTVFAPTNETITLLFALIGGSFGDLNEFNLDFEIDLLRQVLSYHVVPGIVTSGDLTPGTVTTLLPNDGFEIVNNNGEFALIDGLHLPVDLLLTDIPAANGVIHTIDRILIPESVIQTVLSETEQNLLELIENLGECDEFIYAFMLVRDRFEEVLQSQEFTFFLPTNQAFLELFDELDGIDSLADFDTTEELELLGTILLYHLVPETTAFANDLFNNQELESIQGERLNIMINNGVFILDKTADPARVTSPDIEVFSGVIHIIDKVLLPQEALNQLSS
ncbi:fasciclin domain-containing protein [Flagellimonas meridianipacifica]|uniref:Putative surface protein with fasciclin (FAS1) repeats n=1 Tax=Flagellimonas meridianipacifica TaxID=1080225 RepID=A0A2T0MDC2_9FLAO|nr:fasciclin domain-containing protein [Allomuricauda pacifica]PRX55498.1 putative surface protein with fasciclin (FAS1) repeats [Allomuricauda pacifica]